MGQASSQVNGSTMAIDERRLPTENEPLSNSRMESKVYEGESPDGDTVKKIKKRKRSNTEAAEHQVEAYGSKLDRHKVKKRKHKSRNGINPQEQAEKEIESAQALITLRNGTADEGTTKIHGDDVAASAQLLRESSPVLLAGNDAKAAEPKSLSNPASRAEKKRTQKSKKSKSDRKGTHTPVNISEMDEIDFNLLGRKSKGSYLPTPSAEHTGLPKSTLSLDDIDSNDDAVASILEEYQTQMSPPEPSFSRLNEILKDMHGEEDPSFTSFGDGTDAACSDNELPQLSSPLSAAIKDGQSKRRNRRTQTSLDNGQQDSSKLTSELGQWNVDSMFNDQIDYLWPFNLDLADNCPSLTVDPAQNYQQINHDGLSVMQLENHDSPSLDDPQIAQVKAGKLKRITSRKHKHNRPLLQSVSTSNPAYELLNENPPNGLHHDGTMDHVFSSVEDPLIPPSETQNASPVNPPAKQPRKRHRVSSNKKSSSSRPKARVSPRKDPSVAELAKNGGKFTSDERKKICDFQKAYCAEHGMTPYRFATERVHANAHNNARLSSFWSEVYEILPYRNRPSVQKFCRRQFHVYEKRGAWTKEEDEALLEAVRLKGSNWVAVAQICERFHEDCRDRYRNHLHNAAKRNKDQWTDRECKELCRAVGECIYLLQEDKRHRRELGLEDGVDQDENDEEKFINWQIVSEKMNGVRSRLQCSYKWKALKQAEHDRYERQIELAEENMAALEKDGTADISLTQSTPDTNNWRYKGARRKVKEQMRAGDKYDILRAVAKCGVLEEENIIWIKVGQGEGWRDKWSSIDCKIAWETMREGQEAEGGYVGVARKLLAELVEKEGRKIEERWDPDQGASRPTKKGKRKKKSERGVTDTETEAMTTTTAGKGRKKTLSDEVVIDSSDDDDNNNNHGDGGEVDSLFGDIDSIVDENSHLESESESDPDEDVIPGRLKSAGVVVQDSVPNSHNDREGERNPSNTDHQGHHHHHPYASEPEPEPGPSAEDANGNGDEDEDADARLIRLLGQATANM